MSFELKLKEKQITVRPFPALYRHKTTGNIVLFFGKKDKSTGLCISNRTGFSDDWLDYDGPVWERLPEGTQFTFTQE